ncbi:glutamine amidotransferase-like class 1 domain-containing protein 1 isoform X2 [Mycteria americana]|uniref:glutamine amidotransferase-like class 1 domain-containing protein 1 isoform X2 n=1 Tax=Mycteria americana TaxID=33587 RepID=UPI003F584035
MRRRPPPPPGPAAPRAMSDRLGKPTCLIVASAAAAGVSAQSFLHCFTLTSSAFNLQVATPGGKSIDFVDVNESNVRWIQDFRMKSYANPAKLESIDGARYHALLIPNCPGAVTDLANSGYLAKILQHFSTENSRKATCCNMKNLINSYLCFGYLKMLTGAQIRFDFSLEPICAIGHGVAALCCATNEDKSWVFQGYSLTGPSVYELVRQPNFASLSIIVEDFVKDSGATFSASSPDAVHVVLDRHLVTGQNENSTLPAVQNLLILCNVSRK